MLDNYIVFSKFIKKVYKNFSHDLTFQQMLILNEIGDRHDLTMQKVAEQTVMDSTTFSRQIASLEKKGVLVRTPSSQDRRYYFLTLTTSGQEILREMNELFDLQFAALFEGVNEFEKEMIIKSINALTDRMKKEME